MIRHTILLALLLPLTALAVPASGLLFSGAEVSAWQARADKGPFKSTGDAWQNSHGDWERIVKNKDKFMGNPSTDRQTSKVLTWDPVYDAHVNLRDASFYYLVTGDAAVGEAVKQEIYWQIAEAGFSYSPTEDYGASDSGSNFWGAASWFTRLLMAYDFSKDLFSNSEAEKIKSWLKNTAWMYANAIHRDLAKNFPDRLQRNYATATYYGIDPITNSECCAYKDSKGESKNKIPSIARWYNNRRSTGVEFFGLAGILVDDEDLVKHAKIYVEEWITYSMFPDGTTGEYSRSGDYGHAAAGRNYNAINLQTAVLLAEALARSGDTSLYDFQTSNGIGDTAGGQKSIRLGVESHLAETDLSVKRYCGIESRRPSAEAVTDENLINPLRSAGSPVGQQWVSEIWFAPLGNKYWKDDKINSKYTRRTSTSIAYPPANLIASAGPIWSPWGGSGWVLPGMLFMYGDLEKVNGYPSIQISPPKGFSIKSD